MVRAMCATHPPGRAAAPGHAAALPARGGRRRVGGVAVVRGAGAARRRKGAHKAEPPGPHEGLPELTTSRCEVRLEEEA